MEDQIDVLITCSGLGSRLGEITNYTNKSLVRIGTKPALSWIIDSYPKNSRFVVTVGHYSDHVRQYLQIAHSDKNVEIVDVDKFEGKGSSLAYSMLCAKKYLRKDFVFHACDTIAEKHENVRSNCLWISKDPNTSGNYRTVIYDGLDLKFIQEKGDASSSEAYIGKCYIKDHKEFWRSLENIYEDRGADDSSLSDCHAINLMLSNGSSFHIKKVKEWTDIGNLESLTQARHKNDENINVLDKPEESIFFVGGSVIKFFHDPHIVESRVKRTQHLSDTTPRIDQYTKNFYAYKKVEGEILSRHAKFSCKTIESLLQWADQKLWSVASNEDYSDRCNEFYVEKTKSRIKKYFYDRRLQDKESVINGETVPCMSTLIDRSKDDLVENYKASLFHGDFILENILMNDTGEFILLDWRQDFSGDLKFGDAYYDICKLNHNLVVNHDIVNRGLYSCLLDESGNISVDIMCSKKFLDAKETLMKFCCKAGYNRRKVEILTAIIWINMSPLHDRRFGDFLFNFGKYNLYRALQT